MLVRHGLDLPLDLPHRSFPWILFISCPSPTQKMQLSSWYTIPQLSTLSYCWHISYWVWERSGPISFFTNTVIFSLHPLCSSRVTDTSFIYTHPVSCYNNSIDAWYSLVCSHVYSDGIPSSAVLSALLHTHKAPQRLSRSCKISTSKSVYNIIQNDRLDRVGVLYDVMLYFVSGVLTSCLFGWWIVVQHARGWLIRA